MNSSARFARRAVAALTIGLALGLVPAAGQALADDGGRPLATALSGAEEVPAGDPFGSGTASIRVNPGQGEVCYELTVANLMGTVVAAHIHRAPAGVNGPVVVPLAAPVTGSSAACAAVERALALDILRNAADYYVNVHTNVFPGGAVRGQLG